MKEVIYTLWTMPYQQLQTYVFIVAAILLLPVVIILWVKK